MQNQTVNPDSMLLYYSVDEAGSSEIKLKKLIRIIEMDTDY